ncbi:hypothetical protein ACQP2P_31995 [Dactylosporangium sp. CA-139114]|uniref:hypothetical protein n=1 Tax=Dactylosporangium sp. CA-139114 TaxID=3239931 RepID=UPI003D976C7C
MAVHQLLIYTGPVPGLEADYHRWYDEVHVAEVLALPGFVAAGRYATDGPARFAALYTIESDDIDATIRIFDERRADFSMPPSLDPGSVEIHLLRAL